MGLWVFCLFVFLSKGVFKTNTTTFQTPRAFRKTTLYTEPESTKALEQMLFCCFQTKTKSTKENRGRRSSSLVSLYNERSGRRDRFMCWFKRMKGAIHMTLNVAYANVRGQGPFSVPLVGENNVTLCMGVWYS